MAVVLNVYISVGCKIDKDWSIDGYKCYNRLWAENGSSAKCLYISRLSN